MSGFLFSEMKIDLSEVKIVQVLAKQNVHMNIFQICFKTGMEN